MSCFNSKIVDAPLSTVWAAVRDFHQLGWASGVVEACEKIGDLAGNQIGARRRLNGVFEETLQGLNDLDHTITYTIDKGPGPLDGVQGYVGRVRLSALTDGDRTVVEWACHRQPP